MEFSRPGAELKDNNSSNGSLENGLELEIDKFQSISEAGDKNPMNTRKMNIFQTSLTFVATSTGGGILGVPYAFYHMGLFLAIIFSFFMALITHSSSLMYLKVKDLTPRKYESIYEIAYLLFGRPSIFVVCTIQFVANLGGIIMYYMMIGDVISSLSTQVLLSSAA